MYVRWFDPDGRMEERDPGDLPGLAARSDGWLWVDVPEPDDEALKKLDEAFGFLEEDLRDCVLRSVVPRASLRDRYVFFILHGLDEEGHLLELDSFLGDRFWVSTHGPLTPGVPLDVALQETDAVARDIATGAMRPQAPIDVAHAVVDRIGDSLQSLLLTFGGRAAVLDRRAREGDTGAAEDFLEDLYHVRHSILTVRNRAAQTRQTCLALALRDRSVERRARVEELVQEFDRVTGLCDGERDFVQGVLDFYESLITTRMNAAMNRLALISFVVLPATAILGFFGISSIAYDETNVTHTLVLLAAVAAITGWTLRWTKQKGWW